MTPLPSALRSPLSRNVQMLLESRLPARLGWVDAQGDPHVAPMWFEWADEALQISTFEGARKLAHLRDGDIVAATIDTSEFPYRTLRIRGPVTLKQFETLTPSYRRAAHRYLGGAAAQEWCNRLEGKAQILLTIHPTHATASDLSTSSFYAAPPPNA